MEKLEQITTLLKTNGINAVSKQLQMKKEDIKKFLKNNGLIYIEGEGVKPMINNTEIALTKVKQMDKPKDNTSNNKPSERVIQSLNKDIDINKLSELIEMIEPLKQVIQKYNKDINIIEVERAELKVPAVVEVKQKLFKIDTTVLENWNKFIENHKEFKVQSLISLALQEFIDKYK
jgi:hypothetical protein